jgi:hypothetical protein
LTGEGLVLRWFGPEAEPGLGEISIDEGGLVLDAPEPVFHDRGQLARRGPGAQAPVTRPA